MPTYKSLPNLLKVVTRQIRHAFFPGEASGQASSLCNPKSMRFEMLNLLVIEVSPRSEYSISRHLTAQFVDKWQAAHPGGTVTRRDLIKTDLPFVDLDWMSSAFSPPEHQSPQGIAAIKISDVLVSEVMDADEIVIGTPMYNLSIPARLKAYIDQIVRVGLTVSASNEGLLKGKKATVILASGGDFSPGSPFEEYNQASRYLRAILGFVGITDLHFVMAGKTRAIDDGADTLAHFSHTFDAELADLAA